MARTALPLLLLTLLTVGGCQLFPLQADPAVAQDLSQLRYPEQATPGDDLDVLVIVHGTELELVNRTPRIYEDLQLWLNTTHVAYIDRLEIGRGHRVKLSQAVNRFGEAFPVGGLLSPEASYPLVLAEFYDPQVDLRQRLLVRLDEP